MSNTRSELKRCFLIYRNNLEKNEKSVVANCNDLYRNKSVTTEQLQKHLVKSLNDQLVMSWAIREMGNVLHGALQTAFESIDYLVEQSVNPKINAKSIGIAVKNKMAADVVKWTNSAISPPGRSF